MASLFTRTILRLWTSIAPSRWNSPMTLETASRVEAIMFANSWCVRRTPRLVPDSSPSPKRSARFKSRVARRAETSRCRRLSMTSSDCLRRSEKEEKSFMANSGRRFITSVKAAFWTPATSTSVTASAKTSCQRPSTKLSFPKTPTSLCGRRLLEVTIDLVQAYRALQQEIELVVRISGSKDNVFGSKAPLDHPNTRVLEIVKAESAGSRGGRKSPGIMPKHLLCLLLPIRHQKLS